MPFNKTSIQCLAYRLLPPIDQLQHRCPVHSGDHKIQPGGFPKWVPGGENLGLEGPGTSKTGSWTVWKAGWRARGSSGRPSWRSKGRFGRHLGATWAPREAFRGRFWRDLGVPHGSKRSISSIQSGKVQNNKSLFFYMF